jgi:hypothetical protein
VQSLIRAHHWPPSVIDALFLDAQDFKGLIYQYNDLVEVYNEQKKQQK